MYFKNDHKSQSSLPYKRLFLNHFIIKKKNKFSKWSQKFSLYSLPQHLLLRSQQANQLSDLLNCSKNHQLRRSLIWLMEMAVDVSTMQKSGHSLMIWSKWDTWRPRNSHPKKKAMQNSTELLELINALISTRPWQNSHESKFDFTFVSINAKRNKILIKN